MTSLRALVLAAAAVPLCATACLAQPRQVELRLDGVDPHPVAAAPTTREDHRARLTVAPPGIDLPVADTAVRLRTCGQTRREGKGQR